MIRAMPGTDDGLAVIGARFAFAAGAGLGEGSAETAAAAAGLMPAPRCRRPFMPVNLPPAILTGTTVGSFLDVPMQFGPRTGFFWDILALSATGFTAGAITVTKNAPAVAPGGAPIAIETLGILTAAGVELFPRKGIPLLDATERLVFCVTSALTGNAQISGMICIVPAERISEYMA